MANDMNHSSNPTASLSSTTMASISNAMPPHPIRIERMNSQQDTASVSNHALESALTIDRIFRSGFHILANGEGFNMNRLFPILQLPIVRFHAKVWVLGLIGCSNSTNAIMRRLCIAMISQLVRNCLTDPSWITSFPLYQGPVLTQFPKKWDCTQVFGLFGRRLVNATKLYEREPLFKT